jgi:flagellar M-ring protein FliF
MSDFFKQFLTQFREIWVRFNTMQKIILISVFAVTFVGIVITVSISSVQGRESKNVTLFANLDLEQAAQIVAYLKDGNFQYELQNDGRSILVARTQVHEIRMELARNGLPERSGRGFELFDKTQLGTTDFVQNLNFRRALENELSRSIETISEVAKARIHINIPKPTIFMEQKEEATASVVLRIHPGHELNRAQVSGITHLVSNAVEGLRARQVSVIDHNGNMLTRGFAENQVAEHTNHNMELTRSVESYLENKVQSILHGVVGPNNAKVKVTALLDFNQISKKVESFDPQGRVVRSQQRDDGTRRNNPAVGDEDKEGSITNYEIDRTVAHVVQSPGNTQRISVSVAVDGIYRIENGQRTYVPRRPEDLNVITQLVKAAVGFDESRNDEVFVANVQFSKAHMEDELLALVSLDKQAQIEFWSIRAMIALVIILGFLALKSIAKNIGDAMNPPIPRYAGIDLEIEEEEVPENVKRQNEILERMEEFARDNPVNMAEMIRTWLSDSPDEDTPRHKKKKSNR